MAGHSHNLYKMLEVLHSNSRDFGDRMGRIKTKQIKAKTRDFLESNPEDFTTDFEKNKEQLKQIAEFRSKKMRNAVAGYMVRKKKAE